jgi:RNA polymerase sigma factor (TIGR02999 family)
VDSLPHEEWTTVVQDPGVPVATAQVAQLLRHAESGAGSPTLFAALYRELHRLAEAQLRASALPVSATTLLHETYLAMAACDASFPDRARFFAYAARAMRGLIVDQARARRALKRGGAFHITGFDTAADECPAAELSAVDRALEALGASEPKLAELVDLRYFCGFSLREIAAMRAVSERTVQRDWSKARLYLHRALAE